LTCRWRLDSWPKKKLEKKEATRWKSLSKKKIFMNIEIGHTCPQKTFQVISKVCKNLGE
jgi:hypothetical protein